MRIALLAATILVAPVGAQPNAAVAPAFSVLFRPHPGHDGLDHLEVESVLSGVTAGPGAPFAAVPIRFANLTAQVYRDGDVEARDDLGPVPMTIGEGAVEASGAIRWREFTAQRSTQGPIRLRYRAAITPTTRSCAI